MAKFVGYDLFNTMRIRYEDGRTEDVAYIADTADKWWYGDWESYIMNMVEDMRKDGAIDFTGWESMFIIIPDWCEEGALIHSFVITPDDNNIYHESNIIRE